jgi:diaminopimelate epimerase
MSDGSVPVVKMSGAGNDFLVLGPSDAARVEGDFGGWVRRVCRRGLSVGADGVLLVEPAGPDRVRVRFYNPDASEAFCGNGSRCAARFANLRGMAGRALTLETSAGGVPAEVDGERVTLRLQAPCDAGSLVLELGDEVVEGRRIIAGTPHFVTFVADPRTAPLERWGPAVRRHPRFAPEGTNFDLVRCEGATVVLRTWEKGVERETLACGSGAVAAATAAHARGASDRITVVPASGVPLDVTFLDTGEVALGGDARVVFEGRVSPEAVRVFATD